MNYLVEVNAFQRWLLTATDVSTSEIALWYALMNYNNLTGWKREFNVALSALQASTKMTPKTVQKARKRLKELGLIDYYSRKGNQSAVYRVIPFEEQQSKFVGNNYQQTVQQTVQQTEFVGNNYQQTVQQTVHIPKDKQNNNTKDKQVVDSKKESTTSKKKNAKKFIKPTLEEVKEYIVANGYYVDAAIFMDFYDSQGWKVGKNSMKDWKAAVRTWNRRNHEVKPMGRSGLSGASEQGGCTKYSNVEVTEL